MLHNMMMICNFHKLLNNSILYIKHTLSESKFPPLYFMFEVKMFMMILSDKIDGKIP